MKCTALIPIVAGVIAGLLIIQVGNQFAVAQEDAITLPGIAIQDTAFSDLASDTLDPSTAIEPVWALETQEPYRLRLTLPESSVDENQAFIAAESFIEDDLLSHLEYAEGVEYYYPETPGSVASVISQFCFVNATTVNSTWSSFNLMVSVCVNTISGRVVSYDEYWNPEWSPPSALRSKAFSYSPNTTIGSAEAETRAVDFLTNHNYTLPSSTRHVRTWLTTRSATEGVGNGTVYDIVLRTPFGKMFPDRWVDGVSIQVDAHTGRTTRFTYILVEIPIVDIDEPGLISSAVAYRHESDSVPARGWNSTAVLVNTCLRLVHADLEDYSLFALSWSFEFRSIATGSVSYWEMATLDASSGEYLYPGLYRARAFVLSDLILPVQMLVVATVVALVAKVSVGRWLAKT